MTSIALIIMSLLLGFIGFWADGFIGNGDGILLTIAGFFLPSIYILGKIYDQKK